jgi:hypothetical protein
MAQYKGDSLKEIKASYEYDPDYRLVAANGVFGGITPRGELRVDFFAEYTAAPRSVELRITQDGQVTEEKEATPRLIRRIQMGVLLSPDHVESFANWFRAKADEIKGIRKQIHDHLQSE